MIHQSGQQRGQMEVVLGEQLYEADDLDSAVREARRRGLFYAELKVDLVLQGDGEPQEKPVIYLDRDDKPRAVIVQGPRDERFRIFRYRLIE